MLKARLARQTKKPTLFLSLTHVALQAGQAASFGIQGVSSGQVRTGMALLALEVHSHVSAENPRVNNDAGFVRLSLLQVPAVSCCEFEVELYVTQHPTSITANFQV
jgi:GTPase